MSKKKENERFCLNEFFDLLGKVHDEIKSGESPDFIVILQQKKIGIELTDYHSALKAEDGRPRRAIEEDWRSLQETIMREVEKCNELRKTNGLFFFKKLELPPKSKHREFIDELIKLSLEMINSGYKEVKPGENYPILNKYLEEFHLEKVGCYITWDWNHSVSFVGLTKEEELINAVKSKIQKANIYKEKDIDKLWLLIISSPALSQSINTLPWSDIGTLNTFNNLNNLLRQSAYNKIYIYLRAERVIYKWSDKWPGWVKIEKKNFL